MVQSQAPYILSRAASFGEIHECPELCLPQDATVGSSLSLSYVFTLSLAVLTP